MKKIWELEEEILERKELLFKTINENNGKINLRFLINEIGFNLITLEDGKGLVLLNGVDELDFYEYDLDKDYKFIDIVTESGSDGFTTIIIERINESEEELVMTKRIIQTIIEDLKLTTRAKILKETENEARYLWQNDYFKWSTIDSPTTSLAHLINRADNMVLYSINNTNKTYNGEALKDLLDKSEYMKRILETAIRVK